MTTDNARHAAGRADAAAIPVVGVGASAGGLEAFGLLLGGLPADTGMAFVLIQHLAPSHESLLPEILRKKTALPIHEARDGVRLEANHVYVVAAGTEILLVDGRLSVIPRASKATVDVFFCTLARGRGEQAIGVVLSGHGSDGTLGALAIHNEGGLVLAQDPKSCSYDGMPSSVIATGVVDLVLAPEDIGRELARIARHPFVRPPGPTGQPPPESSDDEEGLQAILASLEASTGVSFSDYKPNTIRRRSLRRMAIHSIDRMDRYAELVRSRPQEGQVLFRDVLIHVTSFFRDASVFEVLQREVFPAMVESRTHPTPLKIWVPGCASGEEAFSLAIAFQEFLDARRLTVPLQVFATDLDDAQIAAARACRFPETIAADVSAERLKRFFLRTSNGYQVIPEIRERCVFARHNLLSDPPFSRIDLVSCRNVMIYFGAPAQRRLMPTLHYALNPGGFLLLGASEGIGAFGNLFAVADDKHKIFRRREGRGSYSSQAIGVARESSWPHIAAAGVPGPSIATTVRRRTDEFLARKFAPPAVVIDHERSIIQFRGDTGPYLAPAPGVATLNVLRMARPGIEAGLRSAIQEASLLRQPVRREGLRLRHGGLTRAVNVEVAPLSMPDVAEPYLVVLFEEVVAADGRPHGSKSGRRTDARSKPVTGTSGAARIAELERELAATKGDLQEIVDDREQANETLQEMNEDVVSANEELQSINEELATAKEELQATNEELNTLNDELRARIGELARLSEQLTHLLAGVGAPVVVTDETLTIRQISAGAEDVFQEQPPLVGSLLTANASCFDFASVENELREVLTRGAPRTISISRRDGRRFLLRIQPYRSTAGRIDGIVLVVVDVEDLEQRVAERTSELQASDHRMVMFSYSVSHDLRGPVRAMRGYAEVLLEEAGAGLDSSRRHYLVEIIQAAGRLDLLILSLLSLSRITNVDLMPAPVQLHELVHETLDGMSARLQEHRAVVCVDVPFSLTAVSAHAGTLSQVVEHLVTNAVKFVDPAVRPRVHVRAEDRGDRIRLWVEDNGIGIHPSHHDRVFRIFERLHANTAFEGVGIGLAFVKQALIRMHGAVGLESAEGAGSRFWIDLPTDAADHGPAGALADTSDGVLARG